MNLRRNLFVVAAAMAVSASFVSADSTATTQPAEASIVSVQRIWDRSPYNAFTDLYYFKGQFFCTFREGAGHVSPDGSARVLVSEDGKTWTSVASLTWPDADLRELKFSETPDGTLLLVGAYKPKQGVHRSVVYRSTDGKTWDAGTTIVDPSVWLWRVTWHEGVGYGVGYWTGKPHGTTLYSTKNGVDYDKLVPNLIDRGYVNEHGMIVRADGTAVILLRRDRDPRTAVLGTAKPPYTDWTWRDMDVYVGGPDLIELPDGRIVAGVRLLDGGERTSLAWLDVEAGTLREFLALPSTGRGKGGDTAYPGLVWHEGKLWVSYYSKQDRDQCDIYIAEVDIPSARQAAR